MMVATASPQSSGSRPAGGTPQPSLVARRPLLTSFLTFLALAILHTWPLAARPGYYSRVDNGDYQLNAWAIDWIAYTLPRAPTRLFDANIFHPAHDALAYSEPLILPAVLAAPVVWAGGSAVLAVNTALLLGLTLSAWAFRWSCRRRHGKLVGGTGRRVAGRVQRTHADPSDSRAGSALRDAAAGLRRAARHCHAEPAEGCGVDRPRARVAGADVAVPCWFSRRGR